ncbi:2'-5' RNA ligase family protein [Streptomyces sudanensis]|uniref:2'-5' RNA ligase family protein n=1 Tax=Streptomyces sudanensis TaxID=436397 RepID=UPI0020CC0935|nr:2'-5' RNA ligase family protein [Streptomyces sudanensis]MCP9985410.1 2'-5' RNA ligase family protein [Streptomyces sudanensis]
MHSVELLPDDATERAVRDVWDRLLRAGLPSQAAHRHPTNRPHLTLATAEVLERGTRARLDEALAALPLPLVLRGTVRFTGRIHVLAWAVRRDEALLRVHEEVWRALSGAPAAGRLNPLHDPACWNPHVTLGRGRGAVWPVADDELLRGAPGGPPGVLTGRWVAARTYDSATRTTAPLGPHG